MYKWFFIASFISVAASDEILYTFGRQEEILSKCIVNQLIIYDGTLKSILIAYDVAGLTARRFHGRSISSKIFNDRFAQFYCGLRSGKIKNNVGNDKFLTRLRAALKAALTFCADIETADITNQTEELVTFGLNEFVLSRCIESHLKLTGRQEFHFEDGITETIADSAAKRFHGKSLSRKDFYKRYYYYFRHLREKKLVNEFTSGKLSREIEFQVRQAVEDCAMDKHPLVAVPTFELEPSGIAHILDLVLVKWPKDLYHMIQNRNDRAILRRYSNDALTVLLSELNDFQNNTEKFRFALRLFWNKRATKMYDENSIELPYIVHRYTLDYPTPHMVQSDFEKFKSRNSIRFNERNTNVSVSYRKKTLNISTPDNPNKSDDVDTYYNYNNNDMKSAEYYIENRINQFYRTIFFIMELQARLICTDENDVFDGPLPYSFVPEHVQAIVDDDDVYQDYLSNQRLFFKSLTDIDNVQSDTAKSLLDNDRILEENLILLMLDVSTTSGIQFRSKSTTTVSTTETTTQSLKRKDDVWKNKHGKCFSKRIRTITISDDNSIDDNIDIKTLEEVTESTLEKNVNNFVIDLTNEDSSDEFGESLRQENNKTDNSYGFVTSNDDSMQFQFSREDLLVIQDMCCFSDSSH